MSKEQTVHVGDRAYRVIREGIDWFVYYDSERRYVGKILLRPHDREGPYIAFFRDERVGKMLLNVEDCVALIDRYRAVVSQ